LKNNGPKQMLKPKVTLCGFWSWTTNIVEGTSLATKSIGARYEAPPSSMKNILECAANQSRKLTKSISNSLNTGNFITEIGYNIVEGIEKQESGPSSARQVKKILLKKKFSDPTFRAVKIFLLNDA
jgi:hypothetical protein